LGISLGEKNRWCNFSVWKSAILLSYERAKLDFQNKKCKSIHPASPLSLDYDPKISRIYPSDILVIIKKSTTQPLRTGDDTIRGFDGLKLFQLRWGAFQKTSIWP
jgi:hypothetical protein